MKNLERLGIEPVLKPVAAVQPGDCIPVAGKRVCYQQAGEMKLTHAIASIPTMGFRNFRPSCGGRYSSNAILPVYRRGDIEAALEAQILRANPSMFL